MLSAERDGNLAIVFQKFANKPCTILCSRGPAVSPRSTVWEVETPRYDVTRHDMA